MKIVNVRNLEIGSGMPKICVPVTGKCEEEILSQAREAGRQEPDLVEWRADFYEKLNDKEAVNGMSRKLRDILGQIPIIFTVRTANEGGNCQVSTKDYVNILSEAAKSPHIDLLDVELFMDVLEMRGLISLLHERGKLVIASNHHFHETPGQDIMKTILEVMEKAGADIRKLAVMPSCPEDVLKLLAVTVEAKKNGKTPLITMSMGPLGTVSRICGQAFGSSVTFGTAGAASAPGQLELSQLKQMLKGLQL